MYSQCLSVRWGVIVFLVDRQVGSCMALRAWCAWHAWRGAWCAWHGLGVCLVLGDLRFRLIVCETVTTFKYTPLTNNDMHAMHAPTCLSTKNTIRPHLTDRHRLYTILLLGKGIGILLYGLETRYG